MRTQVVWLIVAVLIFSAFQEGRAAGSVLLRFGSSPVTLTGTLDTDATATPHLYLRLDQPISVAAERHANSASTDVMNQREVEVYGFVSNQPIHNVRIALTGVLSPNTGEARPVALEVRSAQYLP